MRFQISGKQAVDEASNDEGAQERTAVQQRLP
jgi:hypothetical protein